MHADNVWHCPRSPAMLLSTMQQSPDISCRLGPPQQTCDRQTDGQKQRRGSAQYAGSANKSTDYQTASSVTPINEIRWISS